MEGSSPVSYTHLDVYKRQVRRIGRAAGGAAHGFVHGKIYENEQENVGIEGAHRLSLIHI